MGAATLQQAIPGKKEKTAKKEKTKQKHKKEERHDEEPVEFGATNSKYRKKGDLQDWPGHQITMSDSVARIRRQWLVNKAVDFVGGDFSEKPSQLPGQFYEDALADGIASGNLPPEANRELLVTALGIARRENEGTLKRMPSSEPADATA